MIESFKVTNTQTATIQPQPRELILVAPPTGQAKMRVRPTPDPVIEIAPTKEPQPVLTEKPRWISDLIGEDFKKWDNGLVAIEATTGAGKTNFILQCLLNWCVDIMYKVRPPYRILYLTNRNSLRAEIQTVVDIVRQGYVIEEPDIGWTCVIDDLEIIQVRNYQYIEKLLKENPKQAEKIMNGCRFIVCDEAHYFVDDASFNENTTLMYDALMEQANRATVIFMTATPGFMFKSWLQQGKLKQEHYYRLYCKADHITAAFVYRKEQLQEILDKTPADTKSMIFVQRRDRLDQIKAWYGDQAGCYCSNNNKGGAIDELADCVCDEKLQRRFVAATEALYNGINIKDDTVKSIFIEDYRPTKVIQELGRKRWQGVADTCTVYFREPSKQEIAGKLNWNKRVGVAVEACWNLKNGKPDAWNKLLKSKNANERIEEAIKQNYIRHDHTTGEYDVSRMCVEKLREESYMLQKLQKVGYQQFMNEEVWDKLLNVEPIELDGLEVIRYIDEHLKEKLTKEELRAGLAGAGLCDLKTKPEGLKILNQKLERYGTVIRHARKKCRIHGESTTRTCWYLDRL